MQKLSKNLFLVVGILSFTHSAWAGRDDYNVMEMECSFQNTRSPVVECAPGQKANPKDGKCHKSETVTTVLTTTNSTFCGRRCSEAEKSKTREKCQADLNALKNKTAPGAACTFTTVKDYSNGSRVVVDARVK